ncbi:MAG TPA: alpha-hydroxy-acid oxidizing protein [Micropepsaceae bacterium]|nr:alpha-hydroxy-acid oxidizing protein [Micropepsaceae bacterium]
MDVQRRDFLVTGTLAAAAVAAATPALAQTTQVAAAGPGEARGGSVLPGDEKIQYSGGTEVKKLKIINTAELEIEAEKILPKGGYGYIFGGSGAEYTKRENLRAMEAVGIEPHFLSGVLKPDLSATILGHKLPFPIIVPPMGSHGLAHVSKEIGTAQAVAAMKTLMILSMQSNVPLEEVAMANPGPKWMQLYFPADRGYAREVILRAKAAGYTAIVPTIDSTLAYPRDNNIRNDFRIPVSLGKGNAPLNERDAVKAAQMMGVRKVDLNWDDMLWIKQETGLPVVVKGVMSPVTAMQAVERGIDAVYVSNHGGRALDGVPAAISVLPRIADAVKGRVPIIFDSGIRRGQDVFRALALGADVVACGRPILYGLALGGHLGAQSVLEYLRDDLYIVMQLTGTPNIKSITRDHIAPARIA